MKKVFFMLLVIATVSCRSIVNPNEWVVSTATCWNTYTVTKAGSANISSVQK